MSDTPVKLSKSQIEFGEMQLSNLSDRWNISPIQTAKILQDIEYLKRAWDWVNMDEFLGQYVHDFYSRLRRSR